MHPKTRLAVDLLGSLPRSPNLGARLATLAAYGLSAIRPVEAVDRWRARHPLHAYILLTTRCSMSCDDCFFVDVINDKKVGRLDFDLSQIARNYESSLFRSVSRVVLIGGEPTMHKQFIDVIRFFRDRGVLVTCTTNVLHLDRKTLMDMSEAGLNILNMSIYPKTERGKKNNLSRIEAALREANAGAFDPDRIALSFHATTMDEYRWAYEFAVKAGARGLLLNRTFMTAANQNREEQGMAEAFEAFCRQVRRENKINLYFASNVGRQNECPFTTNAFAINPNDELSPCCMVTPRREFGTIAVSQPLMAFKNSFIRGEIPAICQGCQMLGATHF